MVDLIGTPNAKKRRRASALQVATTIYGLLYLYFFIWSFIPCSGAVNPISDSPNVDPWDLGMIFVKLLFLVFRVGYLYSWKNGGIAGLIFLFCGFYIWISGLDCRRRRSCGALFLIQAYSISPGSIQQRPFSGDPADILYPCPGRDA